MNNKHTKKIGLAIVWVVVLIAWTLWNQHDKPSSSSSRLGGGEQSAQSASSHVDKPLDFAAVNDFTLAISWQPGFCDNRKDRPECRHSSAPLALHGFWPGVPKELAQRGVTRHAWNSEGCFAIDHQHSGSFCSFTRPALQSSTSSALAKAMPGEQSCLDRHEYAKHGACFNIPADQYFGYAIKLFDAVNDSRFGQWLADHRGQQVARQDILATFGATFHTSSKALMLMCNRDDRLTELRIGINGKQLDKFPASGSFGKAGNGRCGQNVSL